MLVDITIGMPAKKASGVSDRNGRICVRLIFTLSEFFDL